MIDKFKIGKRIRDVRKHLGFKQKVFAQELGVTGGYLSEIEIGRKSPGMELLIALINKFNANILYLFYGEGGFFKEPEPVKEEIPDTGPIMPDEDWSEKDRLVWLIENIPLVQYAMLEFFISYGYDKKNVIDKEMEKFRKNYKKKDQAEE